MIWAKLLFSYKLPVLFRLAPPTTLFAVVVVADGQLSEGLVANIVSNRNFGVEKPASNLIGEFQQKQ